ncbi:cilia- and flagella-associated protein HOATZ-like [Asterias amurensis]|uniref:cilia- and flagella-associated protein HOATZ-like n=1 Tax=Asterias amurensis TaxID=7602 RepID=UPI003AB713E6
MAATMTATDPISNQGERTVFSGCSEDDQACAKLFWQSLTLQPPIESRLVSGDVKQRLKVAPPGRQTVNLAYEKMEKSQKLNDFLQKAQAEVIYAQSMKLTKQAIARQETLHLHKKRTMERREKEAISHRPVPPSLLDEEDDFDQAAEMEASQAMADLDAFTKKIDNKESR